MSVRSLSRNWRHNTLNANKLYGERLYQIHASSAKRQFLAQVAEPQAFVNASYVVGSLYTVDGGFFLRPNPST